MIRVIESLADFPIRFLPDEDYIGKFEAGMVVQLVTKNGVPCVRPCYDGTKPLGVVGESVGREIYDLVPVWFDTMLFRTDKICNEKFPPGSPLYIKDGLFTVVRPFEDALYVGHVVSTIFEMGDKLIEVNWI